VKALVGGTEGDYDFEEVRILQTGQTKAAFLLWDSLPAVQSNYIAVTESMQEAFGQKHFLDCFRDIAQKQEFCRFLAGFDPALRANCQEQGAPDLDEALIIADQR
jgi:hypothetical protein